MRNSGVTLARKPKAFSIKHFSGALMSVRDKRSTDGLAPAMLLLMALLSLPALGQKAPEKTAAAQPAAVMWTDPGDIKAKDLFNGPGGKGHRPQLPVKFLKEDMGGHNPKFDVEDANGTKWKVKLGIEAQPETVATRLLWSIGYFANENYFVPDLEVSDLQHLRRGQNDVTSPTHVAKARLQRHPGGEKKETVWHWRHNPFKGKREFNGLRVMMALISNWDLKDENNAVFKDKKDGEEEYLVTDLGTAFGASGNRYTEAGSKNNLKAYQSSRFIANITPKYVNFGFPRFPPLLYFFDFPHYFPQIWLRWIGHHIPREDAKWVGSLLAQLSTDQIKDAFRAGGYPPDQAAAFTGALQARIAELNRL